MHDITNEDIATTQQTCEQLRQAIPESGEVEWDTLKRIAYTIDDDHQQMHIVLGSQRRANPSLHEKVMGSVESFASILDTVLTHDIPGEVKSALDHYRENAVLRKGWIQEMNERKKQRDKELGFAIQ